MHCKKAIYYLAAVALAACSALSSEAQTTTLQPSDEAVAGKATVESGLLEALLARIEALETKVATLQAEADRAARPATPTEVVSGAELPALSADPRDQERLIRAAFQRTLIERGGLLLPPKTLDLVPSLRYITSSTDRILIDGFTILPVLVVGDIVSQRVQRELTEFSTTARLGLPWGLQAELNIPVAYQKQRTVTADRSEESSSNFDLGDIEIGLSRQLYKSRGAWPDLLANLRWKTTTGSDPFDVEEGELILGTGFDSISASLTAVKVADPAVVFGGLNYTHNYSTSTDFGRFEPGDSYGFDLGLAIALNLNSSLSFAYDHQFTRRSELDGDSIPGSYLTSGVFSIGASFNVSNSHSVDLSVGIGITEDSPDVLLRTSFPVRMHF